MHRFLSLCAIAGLLAGCSHNGATTALPPAVSPDATLPYHKTFSFTGTRQFFTVPAGITRLTVVAVGARGAGPSPALPGRVYAIIPVKPGQRLTVMVGGAGLERRGGFNGGSYGGTGDNNCSDACNGEGGGGASDVRQFGKGVSSRIVVAGGGGGDGSQAHGGGAGGAGGGSAGASGDPGANSGGGGGGRGGRQNAGGAGGLGGTGTGCRNAAAGLRGSLSHGGVGAGGMGDGTNGGGGGGGGGGGYYGGGGGGAGAYCYGKVPYAGGGGGGGSSFIARTALKYRSWRGWKIGTANGLIVFSW